MHRVQGSSRRRRAQRASSCRAARAEPPVA